MKKFAALALSFVLVTALFAGCRRNVGTETTVPHTSAATEQTAGATTHTKPSTEPATSATQMPTVIPEHTDGMDSTDSTGDMNRARRMPRH